MPFLIAEISFSLKGSKRESFDLGFSLHWNKGEKV